SARAALRQDLTTAHRRETLVDRARSPVPWRRAGAGRLKAAVDNDQAGCSVPEFQRRDVVAAEFRPWASFEDEEQTLSFARLSYEDRERSSGTPWQCLGSWPGRR